MEVVEQNSFDVVKNAKNNRIIIRPRSRHELTNDVNNASNIWMGYSEIN